MGTRGLVYGEVKACRQKAAHKFLSDLEKAENAICDYVRDHPGLTPDAIEDVRYRYYRHNFDNALICARRNGEIFYPKRQKRRRNYRGNL